MFNINLKTTNRNNSNYMLDSFDVIYQNIHSENTANDASNLAPPEKQKLEEDLKQIQEEINELRNKLSLKLQHEADLKKKLGYTLLNEIKSGLKTVKDSQTYSKTVDVLASIKEKTSSAAINTKEIVAKKLKVAKSSNMYKEVEVKVDSFMSTLKNAFHQIYPVPAITENNSEVVARKS